MKLIVGLGNPGIEYRLTRHNSGFLAIEHIATKYSADFVSKNNLFADIAKSKIGSEDILFAKPSTYMNLSGKAVQALLSWYKISVNSLIVVHDDSSLPLGKIRMQKGGGAGGQHGIESILSEISYLLADNESNSFDRLKIGVGPDPGGEKRAQYVLAKIPNEDIDLYNKVIELCTDALTNWVENGIDFSMNKFNGINLQLPESTKMPSNNEDGSNKDNQN
jgi:PTH1 family peptidyl-tRNA hydrolase